MTKRIAQPAMAEVQQPSVQEVDLGPIRIIGCKFLRDTQVGHYVLSVAAAGSIIQIVVSGGGQNARILRDGTELTAPAE